MSLVCRENRNRLTQIMLLKSLLQVSPSWPNPCSTPWEEAPSKAKGQQQHTVVQVARGTFVSVRRHGAGPEIQPGSAH